MARFYSGGCLEQQQPIYSRRNDESKDCEPVETKKLLLDPSLGDVLERLIDAIDLSSSPPHEIVAGLASEGIATWQSFVLTDEDCIKRIPLSLTSAKLLIHLKEMVMDNLQRGATNAKVPTLYTKKKYEEYVIQVNISKRKNNNIDDSSSRMEPGRTSNSDLEASKQNANPSLACANPSDILEDSRAKASKTSMDFDFDCDVDSESVSIRAEAAASGTMASENTKIQEVRAYLKELKTTDDIYDNVRECFLSKLRSLEDKSLHLRLHQQQLQAIMKVEFDELQPDIDSLKNVVQKTKQYKNIHEHYLRQLRSQEATLRQLRQNQHQLQAIMQDRFDGIQFSIKFYEDALQNLKQEQELKRKEALPTGQVSLDDEGDISTLTPLITHAPEQ